MQKDHPCDDYYKRYYLQERGQVRKKKEEKAVKKQIKHQQKQAQPQQQQQQHQMSVSGGMAGANSSIQQMLLMQAAAETSMGGSIINERVQIEVEALLDDYEEKKIAHERLRREEIKRMLDETKGEKAKLKEAAMRELESLKKTLQ